MTLFHRCALAALLLAATAAQAAPHAHVHGIAKLDVAVDTGSITLHLDSPLDNLVGFERAPRGDAERKIVEAMIAKLQANGGPFTIDPAAGCGAGPVTLDSSALKLGHPEADEEEAGHADLDGNFEFHCRDGNKATYIDVGLFFFARLQGLQVQVATGHGQYRRDLKRPDSRIQLTP